MENYEVKGVSNASEIKKAYTEAVADNYKYYRAISKTNQIYGWNENTNNFVKAQDGQEWFENPHYVAPSVEEIIKEPIEEPIEEKEDIIEEVVEVANEMVEEVKAEEPVVEQVDEKPDYEAMYNLAQGTISELKIKIAELEIAIEEKDNKIDDLQEELDDIKNSAQVIRRLFE